MEMFRSKQANNPIKINTCLVKKRDAKMLLKFSHTNTALKTDLAKAKRQSSEDNWDPIKNKAEKSMPKEKVMRPRKPFDHAPKS